MATLRLVPASGPAIDLLKDQSMVGRDPSCEIVVTDGSVSRRHARLEKRGTAWWVVDQGSANGTYVNSLKVAEKELRNNQEIRFGALAFRVDLQEDPEATVATPFLADDSATVMAPSTPPPLPPSAAPPLPTPTPRPAAPPPLPHAASAPPPAPPSAAAAKERFRPTGPAAPVPQMPSGAPPAKKGKGPVFWVAIGCCGCLLLVALLAGVIGGGVFMATKGAADAAHAWLGQVRQGQTAEVAAGMTEAFQTRPTAEEVQALTAAIAQSKDATFLSRSVDNDRATMTGVLTGGPSPQPIVIKLVKEGGTWKVDDVTLGVE
jgi:predicted component of type VI protein secretion system